MKKLLFILLCLPFLMFAQDEKPPSLFEVVNIKVKAGQEEAFEEAVKSHNTQFHGADGLYNARLFYNINGPNGGMYTWIMGPTNYSAMENRPGKGPHNDDWDKVSAMVEEFSSPTYWSMDSDLSHVVADADYSKRLIWVYDLKAGQGKRWSDLVSQVKEVYEEKRPDEAMYVVWNNFADTNAGMDAAVIFPFNDWSWMDRNSSFAKLYEEVHGPGSWHHFLNEFGETTNGRVDWMRVRVD